MYYIYILTNQSNKTLYIGVTNDLKRRFYEHKFKKIDGFTKKYNINKLVYFERYKDINSALNREKELKGLLRTKKDLLIQQTNPDWDDLGYKLFPEFYNTGYKEKK
jgi:putative endonuclease